MLEPHRMPRERMFTLLVEAAQHELGFEVDDLPGESRDVGDQPTVPTLVTGHHTGSGRKAVDADIFRHAAHVELFHVGLELPSGLLPAVLSGPEFAESLRELGEQDVFVEARHAPVTDDEFATDEHVLYRRAVLGVDEMHEWIVEGPERR